MGNHGQGGSMNAEGKDYRESEGLQPESDTIVAHDEPSQGSDVEGRKQATKKPILLGVIAAVVVIAVVGVVFGAGSSNKVTKEDYVTSSMLEKALEIENISTAEFVYNGIAEHYKDEGESNPLFFWEGNDPVDYRICYLASVKAGINMKDVKFDVDDAKKVVRVVLPDISFTCSVNPESMQFIPENTDADMQAIFQLCEEDVEFEALQSDELRNVAETNLRSAIEALTLPMLNDRGYSIEWAESK